MLQAGPFPSSMEVKGIWHVPGMRNVSCEWSVECKVVEARVYELRPEE